MTTKIYPNGGIEIDHNGDADLSAIFENDKVLLGIGYGFKDIDMGYKEYLDFTLSLGEAQELCDWLSEKLYR